MARVLIVGTSDVLDVACLAENVLSRGTASEQHLAATIVAEEVGALTGEDIVLTNGSPYGAARWALDHVLSLRRFHSSAIDLGEYGPKGMLAWASGKQGRRWREGATRANDVEELLTTKALELRERGYEVRAVLIDATWAVPNDAAYLGRRLVAVGIACVVHRVER